MKRKISLILALAILLSSACIPSLAEGTEILENASGYYYIEASGDRPELGAASADKFFQVDGEWFKDLNGNGTLDGYEDWRLDIEDRITDLMGQMTLEEKTALLYHVNSCGDSAGVDFSDSRYLWEQDCPFAVPEEGEEVVGPMTSGSYSMWYYINVLGITHYLENTNGTPAEQVYYHNAFQQIGEDTRLGIPITISSDRQYNTWGGMIDVAHDAFGTANDPGLAAEL